jgi:TonB-dependent receptor
MFLMGGLSYLVAQSGAVSGIVTDKEEGSSLPGAAVYIKGNETTGTITDIDGQFVLSGLSDGDYTVMVSFLGFAVQEIPVQISAGSNVELKVELEGDVVMGQEVLVTGQALGQAKAINQQLNAESISNIVSADRIQELPDVNAAEAISRLPGVSINRSGGEGQKIVVRGLEPKFNAITVNGVRMAANDASDRSVDLSLISPEMLEGIELFKAPLPYMDAEAIGGTVNLKLRKAASQFKMVAKLLGGYNDLNNDWTDYKAVLQGSKRVFNDKLGIVLQTGLEKFNRGGDILTYSWRSGATNAQTGITDIFGNSLSLEDQAEKRRRLNASVNLDYDLGGNHSISLFGLYSRTNRDQFSQTEVYNPGGPEIGYNAQGADNEISLGTFALSGEHPLGKVKLDWNISQSRSEGSTPYNFQMRFRTASSPFDASLDPNDHPRTFFSHAIPNLSETLLVGNDYFQRNTLETSTTGLVNLEIPLKLGKDIGGYFKFGGKYYSVDRSRDVVQQTESFYYLGGDFTTFATREYGAEKLNYLKANSSLISITSFSNGEQRDFESTDGNDIGLVGTLDPDLVKAWYEAQKDILSNNRGSEDENYSLTETIAAGYAMLRLNFGSKLTVIPGFRFEQSDNDYTAAISTISGRYGVNGFFRDTTTYQKYGEFLPHLHIKYQALDWFDIRASYSNTLARPDYRFVTPRAQIDNTAATIVAGNPVLRHARATNYDLFFSAYKGGLGLLTFGAFYKEIDDIFYPQEQQLVDGASAIANGWPDNEGYRLTSFTNADQTTVKGFEVDLQTTLSFLPKPFNGIVLNANYSRLFSETQVFFLTSKTVLVRPFPPVFETTYTSNARLVTMPSQPPSIVNLSIGYDLGGFSARVSGNFQGTKATSYNVSKDFDQFTLEFWRWDASIKQDFGEGWSFFVNLNNFTNQQDITFVRTEDYRGTTQSYGFTGTAGVQFRL